MITSSQPAAPAPTLLVEGASFSLDRHLKAGPPIALSCVAPQQRNWSRVCVAQGRADADSERFFLKQSIDRSGVWIEKLFSSDAQSTQLAGELLEGLVHVPRIVASVPEDLVNVFEHKEMITADALLRRDPRAFRRLLPATLDALERVLQRLAAPPAELTSGLIAKQRPYGSGSTALNFKGFEIRNSAYPLNRNGEPTAELVLFDFGHAYLAPIEEACAKLLVSLGILNWGRPLTRFLRGPDDELLGQARARLSEFVDRDALRAEIELQRRFRSMEFKAAGPFQTLAKRAVISTVGMRYLDRLQDWCDRLD